MIVAIPGRLLYYFNVVFGLGGFALPIGVIGRLWSESVALHGHLLYFCI